MSARSEEIEIATMLRRNGGMTVIDIAHGLNEMLADTMYWLRGMQRDGLIDAKADRGETRYWLTDLGLRKLQ